MKNEPEKRNEMWNRDVLFEYHRAVVPFCWAGTPVRSLPILYSRFLARILILLVLQNIRWNLNKTSVLEYSSEL